MDNNNKKTLVLSILGVLVLVIAVVGVSFAMFSFSATGETENVITTGRISIDYDDTETGGGHGVIGLTNQYPMTDAKGTEQTGDNVLTFSVKADLSGTMTVNYDLGLTNVVQGATLTDEFVKINLYDETAASYVIGSATTGVKVSTIANNAGTYNLLTSYALASGTFTGTTTHKYVLKAWVSDDYVMPRNDENANTDDDATGNSHSTETVSETYKFRVTLKAQQA